MTDDRIGRPDLAVLNVLLCLKGKYEGEEVNGRFLERRKMELLEIKKVYPTPEMKHFLVGPTASYTAEDKGQQNASKLKQIPGRISLDNSG